VRSGGGWEPQLAADVTADPAPDVLGVGADRIVCAVDGAVTSPGAQPGCLLPALPVDWMAASLLFEDLGGPLGADLVVVRAAPGGAAGTEVMVRGGLHVDTQQNRLIAAPAQIASTAAPIAAATTWNGAAGRRLVTIARDGALGCFQLDDAGFGDCH
jgi:hypothetical protein